MNEENDFHYDFNSILEKIGGFGKWQARIFFSLWLPAFAGGLAVVVYVFTANLPDHRCSIPYCVDTQYLHNFSNVNEDFFPNECQYKSHPALFLPDLPTQESCNTYIQTVIQNWNSTIISNCSSDGLIFDLSKNIHTSIAIDNGWTCQWRYVKELVGASYMVGMLIGSFVLGIVSDKYGRVKALMVSIVLVSIPPVIGSFISGAFMIAILRFLTGVGGIGCFMVSFVLVVECVSLKYTMLLGIAIEIPFALGELVLGIEAYFIRDWVPLQIVAYSPLITFLILWFIVPESPRWLLAKKEVKQAKQIISSAISLNNKNLNVDSVIFESKTYTEGSLKKKSNENIILDMFTPPKMMFRTINMFYQWFSVTLCYYGLSFASTSLSGDKYTNFILSICIEIPAYLFCMLAMDSWGRRPILSLCQAMSGICCIIAGLLGDFEAIYIQIIQVIFSLIGKFGASACFAIVYVYTAELFPTKIRNTAIGSCSSIARVGGILAFLIKITSTIWKPLPMIILGSISTVAGILAFAFPETIGKSLPETNKEALNIGKDTSRSFCQCTRPWWYKKR